MQESYLRQETERVSFGAPSDVREFPGDVTSLPNGHDAWVVGDEPAVVVDWYGATNYARAD